MKIFFSKKKKQKNIVLISLLCFLLSGVGLIQTLPTLLLMIGNSHPIFITETEGKIHLVLHHRGNQDEHEHEHIGGLKHQHDLIDKVIAVSGKGTFSHTDHEVEIPNFKKKAMTKTENVVVTKNLTSLRIAQILPASIKLDVIQFISHSPPTTNPTLGSLQKTALLI
ncbi:MAG: hypothetical protein ACE5HN_00515 [Nitrospiria bacterium]